MKKRENMNTMFKVIVTMKNGAHKVLRVARWMVARITYQFREQRRDVFNRMSIIDVHGDALILNDCQEIRFVYENTHQTYLTLS